MNYNRIYGYHCSLNADERKYLCENDMEFAEIESIIRDYEKCVWLQQKYFCRKELINEEDPEFREAHYVYDNKLAEENKKFMIQWPKKRKTLAEKLQTHKFLTSANKRIKNDLEYGEKMFSELSEFFAINQKFENLEKSLTENNVSSLSGNIVFEHIIKMYEKRQQIAKTYMQEKIQNSPQPE